MILSPSFNFWTKLLTKANIGYLRQQAEAYNKRPLPATEDQVKGLVKLAERDRPLEVKVETEEVVKQLVGKVEQLTAAYLAKSDKLIQLVDDRTDYLTEQLKAGVGAVQTASADMKAGAKLIPSKMTVDFKQGWRWVAGLLLGPVAFLLLGQAVTGQFSKVSKSDFEQLQAKNAALQVKKEQIDKEGRYYLNQIKRYKEKNPNKTTDFPAYKPAE